MAVLLVLLTSCELNEDTSNPTSAEVTTQMVPNLPSISELAGTPTAEVRPLPTFNSKEIILGQNVYSENCAECHGENLEGENNWQMQNEDGSFRSPPHDDTGHTWHHSDRVLIESIELGGARLPENIGGFSEMPAYKDTLTEEEMVAVLNYIKNNWPEDIQGIQWGQTVQENDQ